MMNLKVCCHSMLNNNDIIITTKYTRNTVSQKTFKLIELLMDQTELQNKTNQ